MISYEWDMQTMESVFSEITYALSNDEPNGSVNHRQRIQEQVKVLEFTNDEYEDVLYLGAMCVRWLLSKRKELKEI